MSLNKKQLKEFVSVLKTAARDEQLLEDFFVDITTPGEREAFWGRWQIVKRLHKGEPQRQIAEDLGVGIATVTRGSRELASGTGALLKVLKKLN